MKRIALIAVLFTLAACGSAPDTGAPINKECPISSEPVDASSEFVMVDGHRVAFCCGGCADDWNKMPDAEKKSAIAQLLQN